MRDILIALVLVAAVLIVKGQGDEIVKPEREPVYQQMIQLVPYHPPTRVIIIHRLNEKGEVETIAVPIEIKRKYTV